MVGSRIVATGCTSGLGFKALYQIIKTAPSTLPPPYHIYLLARDANAAHSLRAKGELEALAQAHGGNVQSSVELRQANLSSLESVREAAQAIKAEVAASSHAATKDISPGRIDVFLLNAGMAATTKRLVGGEGAVSEGTDARQDSSGQYEETACVNHISQQLLLSLLLPDQLRNTTQRDRPVRVVFTGSALHRRLRSVDDLQTFFDPSSETTWDMMRAYGASKFLQMLGVQHLVRLLQERHRRGGEEQVEVVVVQPGFVPNTGLSRESSLLGRVFMQHILPRLPFSFITTPEQGASYIADACYRPLQSFPLPARKGEEAAKASSSSWLEEGAPPHDGVRKVLVVKGGEREAPDERTENVELARKWWPALVEREWQAATSSAS